MVYCLKYIMHAISCYLFGHDKTFSVIAYHIDSYCMFYKVHIVSLYCCKRCGHIGEVQLDAYERHVWHTQESVAREEEQLRLKGFVSLSEAYETLTAMVQEERKR